MKSVYSVNNGNLVSKLVKDNYEIQAEETFIKPADGLWLPVRFENGQIVGSTEEEHDAVFPSIPAVPTTEQLMINALGQQMAQLQAKLAQGGAE